MIYFFMKRGLIWDCQFIIKKMISGEYPSLINNGYEVAKKKELSIIGKELCDVYNQVLNSN